MILTVLHAVLVQFRFFSHCSGVVGHVAWIFHYRPHRQLQLYGGGFLPANAHA